MTELPLTAESEEENDKEEEKEQTPERRSPQPVSGVVDETWPTASQAAKVMGTSRQGLYHMRDRGLVRFGFDVNGTLRFHPDDIDNDGSKETQLAQNLIERLTATVEKLLEMTVEPYARHSKIMAEALEQSHERIGRLESKMLDIFEVYQVALTQEHERQIAAAESAARQERIDRNVKMAWDTIPAYVDRFLTSRQLGELVDGISDEQLAMFVEIGAIRPEQAEMIRNVKTEALAKRMREQAQQAEQAMPANGGK